MNEALQCDIQGWKLMCTSIATTPAFYKMFPPKKDFMAYHIQSAWLIAAFYVIIGIYGTQDKKRMKLFEKISQIIECDDNCSDDSISLKIETLMDLWDGVFKNNQNQIDYVRSVMARIKSTCALDALIWIFCLSFVRMLSDSQENLEVGADFLHNNFVEMIKFSKALKLL